MTVREYLEEGYRIATYCRCGRNGWLDLEGLVRRGFGDVAEGLSRRLRCQVCGARGISLRVHPPCPDPDAGVRAERLREEQREKVVAIGRRR